MILASDYDGTLFFHEDGTRPEDIEAIRNFQQAGHVFGLCTGRPVSFYETMVHEDLQDQVRFDFRIFSNGALVLDRNDNPVLETFLPDEFVRKVLDYGFDHSLYWHVSQKSPFYGQDPKDYARIAKEYDGPLYLYGLSFDIWDEKGKAVRDILDSWDGVVGYSNPDFHDIVAEGVSKARTFHWLCENLKISKEQRAGIGDSYNDLEMISTTEHGFTFHRSPRDIQQQAAHVVDSIADAIDILLEQA